jgi:hypothetical protein
VKNITVSIDAETYLKARRKAAMLDTSVSKVVASYLRTWTAEEGAKKSRAKKLRKLFASVSERNQPGSAVQGGRGDLYAERIR